MNFLNIFFSKLKEPTLTKLTAIQFSPTFNIEISHLNEENKAILFECFYRMNETVERMNLALLAAQNKDETKCGE